MDPYLAQVIMFGGNFAVRGWANCDGGLLAISSYSALFSILGTTYGGDGRTTFGLPDMRGRVPIHPGTGPGLPNYRQGPGGGAQTVTLATSNLPSHNHTAAVNVSSGPPSTDQAEGDYLAQSGENRFAASHDVDLNSSTTVIGNTGGGQSFSIVQSWCSVQFIIALEGTFPSRS